jgi:hypothetical protein
MNMLNIELARSLQADRVREFEGQRLRSEARRTRPATKHPEPSVRRQPGLLARLVPWFGAHSRTA